MDIWQLSEMTQGESYINEEGCNITLVDITYIMRS